MSAVIYLTDSSGNQFPATKGTSKIHITYATAYTANNDITTAFTPTNAPTILRVAACFSASGKLSMKIGATTIGNFGTFTANEIAIFDVLVNDASASIKFVYDTSCNIQQFDVIEIPAGS